MSKIPNSIDENHEDNDKITTFDHRRSAYHFIIDNPYCDSSPAQFNEQGEEYRRILLIRPETLVKQNHED